MRVDAHSPGCRYYSSEHCMEYSMVTFTDGSPVPSSPPPGVRDHIVIATTTCLALGKGDAPTSTEIAEAYGIDEGKRTGVVVRVGGYHGYAANNIWEKLKSWDALSQ